MLYTLLLVLIVLFAGLGALLLIGAALLRMRASGQGKKPRPEKKLDPAQADEITSTWTLLH